MNTILVYAGAIFLSILTVIIIDAILVWISREPDDDLCGIAVINGILAACLIAILLISKV